MELSIIKRESEIIVALFDDDMRLVKPVWEFLKYQRLRGMAHNTIKAYGRDLKILWDYLKHSGYAYDEMSIQRLSGFVEFLRQPQGKHSPALFRDSSRQPQTINHILGTVHSFYQYCEIMNQVENPVFMKDIARPQSMFKSFLYHTRRDNQTKQSIFKVKESSKAVRLVQPSEIDAVSAHLNTSRDRLILKTLQLTGARIAEVLELRIADIPYPDSSSSISSLQDIKSKGGRRTLFLPTFLLEEIDRYILEERALRWGQLHMPEEVPQTEIFAGNEYIGTNSKLKIEFIPDEIMARVSSALEDEQNLFMKYGIIILRSTAMRIEDMLRLKAGCLVPQPISGATLTWYNHKNRKQQPPMPIPDECANAVQKIAEHTAHLRIQASPELKELIFLRLRSKGSNAGKVTLVKQSEFRNDMLDFVARHNITNQDGELYHLTPHKFRRTLATDMLSKGTNISVIQSVLGHSAVNSTKMHYADVKDSSRADAFRSIGIIGNIHAVDESVIPDSAELSWFQENQNGCAKMCDGYCTQPFQRGVLCERLLNRQKCYTCSRYITTPEYLEHHREYLRSLEAQLANNPYGHHYAEHFSGTVAVLKEIIAGLEALIDD